MIDGKRLGLANLIHRLEVISEVSAVNLEPMPPDGSENSKGGNRPSGGVDRKADRSPEFALKSAEHFKRRAARCHTDRDYDLVIADVQAAIRANTHSPLPSKDPLPHEGLFRRHLERVIKENEQQPESKRESDQHIAWRLGIDRSYVGKVRRDLAA